MGRSIGGGIAMNRYEVPEGEKGVWVGEGVERVILKSSDAEVAGRFGVFDFGGMDFCTKDGVFRRTNSWR